MKDSNYQPVSRAQFSNIFKASHGHESFLDIDLLLALCPGVELINNDSGVNNDQLLSLTHHYIVGNEIVEVVQRRGGVLMLGKGSNNIIKLSKLFQFKKNPQIYKKLRYF